MTRHQKPLVITKANCLVEATYRLTLAEQRLVLFAIAKLDSRAELSAGISHTITAREFGAAYNLPTKQAFELLKDAAARIYGRSVTIDSPDEPDPIITRWVATRRVLQSTSAVELFFAPGILPFLSQLHREFSQYRFDRVAQMTSIYAIRLYELLIQWRQTGTRTVDIVWLRERFELNGKYSNIRDLKRFVVHPAVEQINKHSDLWVKYDQKKAGRVIVALTFLFGEKPLAALSSPTPKQKKLTRKEIEQHARPGESWEQAEARLRREIESRSQG